MTRLGDYMVLLSMSINACAALAYLYERHWHQAMYWSAAFMLNLSLLLMR